MGSLIPWIEVTIPGILFLVAAFFAFLRIAHYYDLRAINLKTLGTNTAYIAIAVAFFSYVVGLAVHLLICQVIAWFWPSSNPTTADLIRLQTSVPEKLQHSTGGTYGNLVMFRLMLAGFAALELSLIFWLRKAVQPLPKRSIHITCAAFIVFFICTYLVQRTLYQNYQSEIKSTYPPRISVDSCSVSGCASHNKRQADARTLERQTQN